MPYLKVHSGFQVRKGLVPNRGSNAIENRIARLRVKAGLRRTRRPWTPEDDIRLDDYRRRGMTVASIAAETGRSQGSVKERIYSILLKPSARSIRNTSIPNTAAPPSTDQ